MVTFRRKPAVKRGPWHCTACGAELPTEQVGEWKAAWEEAFRRIEAAEWNGTIGTVKVAEIFDACEPKPCRRLIFWAGAM